MIPKQKQKLQKSVAANEYLAGQRVARRRHIRARVEYHEERGVRVPTAVDRARVVRIRGEQILVERVEAVAEARTRLKMGRKSRPEGAERGEESGARVGLETSL